MSKHTNKYTYVQKSHGLIELSDKAFWDRTVEERGMEYFNMEMERKMEGMICLMEK